MKRTNELVGERLPDVGYFDQYTSRKDAPGSYRKVVGFPASAVDYPSNLTGQMWIVMTPNGLHGALGAHTVREEDDGSITVKPGDGSSNSILVTGQGGSWHGYITRGLWWSLEERSTEPQLSEGEAGE